ncbi:MAG: hypothetical protein K9F92_03205 [Candidatus Nanopelagicaceae bacterium]|nr:hypothetical protein [Candidatus Nanopelagicaceae bacterium]
MSQDYIAGACNIGPAEIKQRKTVAFIGLALSVISLAYFISSDSEKNVRLTLLIPFTIFAIGFVQSRKKFCLAYGFLGTFNFGKLGKVSKVADSAAKKADRDTAIKILFQSLLLALGLTLIAYLLPF